MTAGQRAMIVEMEGKKPKRGGKRSESSIGDSRRAAGVSDEALRRGQNVRTQGIAAIGSRIRGVGDGLVVDLILDEGRAVGRRKRAGRERYGCSRAVP